MFPEARRMLIHAHRVWTDESGVATVEYALLLALVVVAGIGAWTALGSSMKATLNMISTSFATP